MKIAIATNNQDKVKELKVMLNMPEIELYTMNELGIKLEIEENGNTFEENAMIKADALYNLIDDKSIIVIADDSGLSVNALNGAPGIYSARYSGKGQEENKKKLLQELTDIPPLKRDAYFACAIALISKDERKTFVGKCYGLIDKEEHGENGFGYDPLFYFPLYQKTFAEMTLEEKNKVSHRANAVKLLKEWLENFL